MCVMLHLFLVGFRSGRKPVLIATDVAARGLGKWLCGRREKREERKGGEEKYSQGPAA